MICQTLLSTKVPSKAVAFSSTLMKVWNCINGQSINIRIGNKSLITRVVNAGIPGNKIIFSPEMSRQLYLPYTNSTRASFFNKTLRMGPVIAILTTGYTGNPATPFGERSALFKGFIQAGSEEKPFFYVFTPEMVDWTNQVISGWYYERETARWVRKTSPFPDVIYERLPNRKAESLAYVQDCLARLKENNQCQVFNQGFFNKWSIHKMLNRDITTAEFIPESYLAPSIEKLKQLLQKYNMVYLKPSGGSLGLGIFRITYDPKKGYLCRYHNGKSVLQRFDSLEKLISTYFGGTRFKHYIVQQGIRLIRYQDHPVDFRVHMHKDRSDEWKVIAIGSKVAGDGCITTHVRTGGFIVPTDELLTTQFGEYAKEIETDIQQAAIRIAQALEQQVDGPLGELGLDMGIDVFRKVWLFEVNAKPGRHIFHHPSLREAGHQSAKCITDFSLKLTNFL